MNMKSAVLVFVMFLAASSSALPLTEKSRAVCEQSVIDEVNNDRNSTWVARDYSEDLFRGMDMTEVKQSLLGLRIDREYSHVPLKSHKALDIDLPDEFNAYEAWPLYMHPIRDQMHCGSCWAFAASEVLGDRFALASKGKINHVLSPEDMVSCDKTDHGCQGGYLDKAWAYLADTGIVTEECFPYGAGKGTAPACRMSCVNSSTPFKKYKAADVYQLRGEEDIMKEVYINGPVEAGFRVYSSFMSYSSGVYKHKILDIVEGGHAIKIVGWGVQEPVHFWQKPVKYWLCANSWTTGWGDKGFFKIVRGENRLGKSECVIEDEVFAGHPLLPSPP
jgi:cathepsin B